MLHYRRSLEITGAPTSLYRSLRRSLYYSFDHVKNLGQGDAYESTSQSRAGIFGLDFSPDGSILVAACEDKSLLLTDPLTHRTISSVSNAHKDCVNTIRFLDDRLFASCSDDCTASLWDVRNLSSSVRVFRGHTNWVKNVEYDSAHGMLLTSAFDGHVFKWDMNSYKSEEECTSALYTPGLMRMRLTADGRTMIVSSQWGYLLLIHDLDLSTIDTDLHAFKPNIYWLMMKANSAFANASLNSEEHRRLSVFSAPRNRAEIVVDFPQDNDPENITSLTPHPHAWCVISRNTNMDEQSEWTCVHDIQWPPPSEPDPLDSRQYHVTPEFSDEFHLQLARAADSEVPSVDFVRVSSDASLIYRPPAPANAGSRPSSSQSTHSSLSSGDGDISWGGDSPSNAAADIGDEVIDLAPSTLSATTARGRNGAFFILLGGAEASAVWTRSAATALRRSTSAAPAVSSPCVDDEAQVPRCYSRLTHYTEEANVARGFVKETSMSSDGLLLASPYAYGVRLFAFNQQVDEMCDVGGRRPTRLCEVRTIVGAHKSHVLCTKFSPSHMLLATGCLGGKIAFCQPVYN